MQGNLTREQFERARENSRGDSFSRFAAPSTQAGLEFLKLTAILENANSLDETTREVTAWLELTSNMHLLPGFNSLLAELNIADEKLMSDWQRLLLSNDPKLSQKDEFKGQECTLGEKIEKLAPSPITRIIGYRLAIVPENSLNALTAALLDIGSDRESAKRFFYHPLFPLGYIKKDDWEKHQNSPLSEREREMISLAVSLGKQEVSSASKVTNLK